VVFSFIDASQVSARPDFQTLTWGAMAGIGLFCGFALFLARRNKNVAEPTLKLEQ